MRQVNGGRVVVGIEDSLTGLRALRVAVAEARRRGAQLHALRSWTLPSSGAGATGSWYDELERAASAEIIVAFDKTMGGVPRDVEVVTRTVLGRAGKELVRYADRDDDTLVVGAQDGGRLRRLLRRSVSRYCVGHARCPVLVVPPDTFARQARREGMDRAIRRDLSTLNG
ncbi:universal stress protein [Dactylosporangium sp. CA-092794]|uniref:universal stress protein n=1 Tax=Dactylosporangium sp. CA-092794 TaxID=3239929 RepID=UPI003D8E9229